MTLFLSSLSSTNWVLILYIFPRRLKQESFSNQKFKASANRLCASRRRNDDVIGSTVNNSTSIRPNALSSNVNGR
ncbi:hypothetical protein BT93_E1281 [Corymbia citriodora subsp. variegata]|nr:hypothetical protein BT93_E1281 [Corymbia citriodora subsp. variegata]